MSAVNDFGIMEFSASAALNKIFVELQYGKLSALYSMEAGDALLQSAILLLIVILSTYILGFVTKYHSWVDRFWSIIPVVYAGIFAHPSTQKLLNAEESFNVTGRPIIMFSLCLFWGSRLTFNFYRKGGYNLNGEDYRWAYVRKWFPNILVWELFHFWFICVYQNILLWLLSIPVLVVSTFPSPLGFSDAVLVLVYLVLLFGETLADEQQWAFQQRKKQFPKGKEAKKGFIDTGLFKYSRHPNFFCEISMWFTLYGFSIVASKEMIYYDILGPFLLFLLFLGSTWLTEKISSEKYPSFKAYQMKTSMLLPWFPKIMTEE